MRQLWSLSAASGPGEAGLRCTVRNAAYPSKALQPAGGSTDAGAVVVLGRDAGALPDQARTALRRRYPTMQLPHDLGAHVTATPPVEPGPPPPAHIRVLALAVLLWRDHLLCAEGYDTVKQQTFFRPLGGGVEFGERAELAAVRELREELSEHGSAFVHAGHGGPKSDRGPSGGSARK